MKYVLLVFINCLLFFNSTNADKYSEVEDLKIEQESFKEDLESIDKRLLDLEEEFYDHKIDFDCHLVPHAIYLNFKGEKRFKKITTNYGHFFIIQDRAEPYLDGYKIFFRIGNPYYCTFANPKIKASWNILYTRHKGNASEWIKNRKNKEFSILTKIEKGKWNMIELVLNPCSIDELEHVGIELEIDEVILYE